MTFIGLDWRWTTMQVLPAGTPLEVKDWDENVLEEHAIYVTNQEDGAFIGGTKAQLVALLEGALHDAWALPDDPEGTNRDEGDEASQLADGNENERPAGPVDAR